MGIQRSESVSYFLVKNCFFCSQPSLTLSARSYSNSLQSWAEDPDKVRQEDEDEEARKDRLKDKDDEVELQRERAWDEFKDGKLWFTNRCLSLSLLRALINNLLSLPLSR